MVLPGQTAIETASGFHSEFECLRFDEWAYIIMEGKETRVTPMIEASVQLNTV